MFDDVAGLADVKVIDTDSHWSEPYDLWTTRAPAKYRDRVPRMEERGGRRRWWFDDDIPIDLSLLPDVTTLTQHLYGAVTWSTNDGNGFATTSIGPWGPEVMALVGALAGAGTAAYVSGVQEIR